MSCRVAARTGEDAWQWHARFGHTGFTALKKMAKEQLVCGLPPLEQVEQLYEACLTGKQRSAPFPKEALHRTTKQLERVHDDLYGPVTLMTPSRNAYFLHVVDDYGHFMWVALLPTKDCTEAAIKRITKAAKLESGHRLYAFAD